MKSGHGNAWSLRGKVSLALVIAAWLVEPVAARYIRPDLDNVPVERIVANLEELAKKNPKDAQIRFNLARVHAMAFALKSDTAQVRKGDEARGAWFGYEPPHVPFAVKPSDDPARLKAAREHLEKAIARYQEAINLGQDNLPARLGQAWCLQQAGEKGKAIAGYRKVIEDAWQKEKDLKRAPLGWHSVTAETAGYLIPLLDKEKNGAEIATLQERIKQMRMVPRPITPIVVPLRDGLRPSDLEDRAACVRFDADGTGLRKPWSWITPDAGWLAHDPQGRGEITSSLQMFGSVTFWLFWANGYEALRVLDDDGDGTLSGTELRGLAIWQDRNGDGRCDPGEVRPVSDWGIVALSCRWEKHAQHRDGISFAPEGVRFRNGSVRPTYDLILQPR